MARRPARPPSTVSGRGGLLRALGWALGTGGQSRGGPVLAWRALVATVRHPRPLRRWMAVVQDLGARGLATDVRQEYLRAIRPFVHRHTDVGMRVSQLIDHLDWMEAAFQPGAFESLVRGQPLVLAELPPPRGYESMQLQLRRNLRQSPEGDLLMALSLRRSAHVQPAAPSLEVAVLAFTRIRLDGLPCLAIGGVRGQREPVARLSANEVAQALHGWKAPVFMVRVAQELARWWGLHLVGLDPRAHRLLAWPQRWRPGLRASARRIGTSYQALWEHFDARPGPRGWVVLPLNSDEKLAATALSTEKRARQVRRADYWIRTRNLLREEFRRHLVRQAAESVRGPVTQNLGPKTIAAESSAWAGRDFQHSEDIVPSRSLDTGPGSLD